MVDDAAKMWPAVAARIGDRLPGDWVVAGRGINALLVRRPVDWVLVWVSPTRARRTDHPYLMGGATPLVNGPIQPRLRVGLRSDARRDGPSRIDFTSPDHEAEIEQFIVRDMLPLVDPWTPEKYAADAEHQYALPLAERGMPRRWFEVPGWRVVLDSGSPVEPARQAADWGRAGYAPEIADWQEALIAAWESGGRPAALTYLEDQRTAALTGLKIPA